MSVTINASTSSGLVQTADTSGTLELQSNGTTKFTVSSTGAYGQVVSGTAVASTSGTSIDFTSIPSWVKRVTVMFNGTSLNASGSIVVQIGSGSFTTSGYAGSYGYFQNAGASALSTLTTGFGAFPTQGAADVQVGMMVLTNVSGNIWISSISGANTNASVAYGGNGAVTLSGVLDRVRITTVAGTSTFDAGSINILYEG